MQALKHFWSVYYSLARYTAGSLLLIVLLVLCSLAALLISLVLPWQLLTAIDGRSSVRWHWLIADQPVMAIGLIVLAAFVVHVLCEWAIGQVGKHGAQRLLDAHAKIGLPIGYQGKTYKYFMILARLLSSSILLLAVLFLLLWVYPSLALGMTVYLLVCSLLAVLAWCYPAFRVLVQAEGLSKYGWHLGFIFVLAWIVFTYPYVQAPALVWIVICVIACRQMLIQLFTSLLRVQLLWKNQEQVFLLFLPDRVQGAKAIQEPLGLQKYIQDLSVPYTGLTELTTLLGLKGQVKQASCFLVEKGHAAYVSLLQEPAGDHSSTSLLKLYDASRQTVGEHERTLLEQALPHWPVPPLLAVHQDKDLQALIWPWEAQAQWLSESEKRKCGTSLRTRLLACSISEDLQARYERANAPLHERWFKELDWQACLLMAEDEAARERLDRFRDKQVLISERLEALPGQLVLPSLLGRRVARSPAGQHWLMSWSRWQWMPAGAGWPSATSPAVMRQALQEASAYRCELLAVDLEDAMLACQIYALWFRSVAKNLSMADILITRCLSLLPAE